MTRPSICTFHQQFGLELKLSWMAPLERPLVLKDLWKFLDYDWNKCRLNLSGNTFSWHKGSNVHQYCELRSKHENKWSTLKQHFTHITAALVFHQAVTKWNIGSSHHTRGVLHLSHNFKAIWQQRRHEMNYRMMVSSENGRELIQNVHIGLELVRVFPGHEFKTNQSGRS